MKHDKSSTHNISSEQINDFTFRGQVRNIEIIFSVSSVMHASNLMLHFFNLPNDSTEYFFKIWIVNECNVGYGSGSSHHK